MKWQSLLHARPHMASALPHCLITQSYILHSLRAHILPAPVLHSYVLHKSDTPERHGIVVPQPSLNQHLNLAQQMVVHEVINLSWL